jgi:hypothetical protein
MPREADVYERDIGRLGAHGSDSGGAVMDHPDPVTEELEQHL